MIKVNNISKSFSDKLIFRNVSFDINNGDSIAIIGQSGPQECTIKTFKWSFET